MDRSKRIINLIAFISVMCTGIILTLVGVNPEALAVVVIALAGLYQAWLHSSTDDSDDRNT